MLLLLLLLLVSVARSDVTVFVDPVRGDDAFHGGAATAPLKTLAAAQRRLRQLRADAPEQHGQVLLLPGVHFTSTLTITAEDSRSTWRSADPASPATISAGFPVPFAAFKPYKDQILMADLKALNISNYGSMISGDLKDCQNNITLLYYNGKPMTLARYPNLDPATDLWTWSHIDAAVNDTGFTYNDDFPAANISAEVPQGDVWVHGYWTWDWWDKYCQVKAIDTSKKYVEFGIGGMQVKDKARFMVVNALGVLDQPGEFYINRQTGILYFWPPEAPGTGDEGGAFVSGDPYVFYGTGASYFTLQNVTLLHAQKTAVYFEASTKIQVLGCRVANHGNNGTVLLGDGHVVADSEVTGVGCMGVSVLGGNRTSLTGGHSLVLRNHIHHFATWKRTYQAGVFWAGVGHVVDSNHISFAPHNAILGGANEDDQRGGNNCIFINNLINYTTFETDDSGAFYTCGQDGEAWINLGNVVQNNTFMNIRPVVAGGFGKFQVQAVYLDDQISGYQIVNNNFINVQVGMLVGGGRKSLLNANTFRDVDLAISLDNRGMNWQNTSCTPPQGEDYVAAQKFCPLPAWKPYNCTLEMPCVPIYNHIENNTYCNTTKFTNLTPDDIKNWLETVNNNVEKC